VTTLTKEVEGLELLLRVEGSFGFVGNHYMKGKAVHFSSVHHASLYVHNFSIYCVKRAKRYSTAHERTRCKTRSSKVALTLYK